jgi:hypothetical protein
MYFIIPALMASVVLVVAIPIAFAIALTSSQEGTRLAPERNSALRAFAMVLVIVIAALLLLAVFCGMSSL